MTARAFWGTYSASASSAGETQDRPGRQVAQANVAPVSFFGEIMPKRAKNIWADVVSYENLFAAFRKVRKGKRFHPAILKMYYSLDDTLFNIRERLIAKTWTPAPYREFWVQEHKPRCINAPAAPDRVVHWALMKQVAPIFERRFITDSYACREGKGAHIASRRAREYIRAASQKWSNPYILKADISKYFPSIDQAVLMQRVERIIADESVLWLFDVLIRNGNPKYGVGIPIGAFTSQWLANLYLDGLDHYMKDDLGIRYYLRYMDDFVVIGPSKSWCRTVLEQVETYVTHTLHLRLNPKTGIWPVTHGLDFVGYRHWSDHVLPRKRTVKRARAQFKCMKQLYAQGRIDLDYIRPRVASFTGYMSHCDGYETLEHILNTLVLVRK